MTSPKVNTWSLFDLPLKFLPSSECTLCKQLVIPRKEPDPQKTAGKSSDSHLLCVECHDRLPRLSSSCQVCCMPLTVTQSVCGGCLRQAPFFQRTIAAFHYEPPVDSFITALKFNHQFQFIPLLIRCLIEKIGENHDFSSIPTLVPVPLHTRKLRQRGFNQAYEISKYLAKSLNLKINTKLVRRIKQTSAQSDLDATARRKNMRGAFQIEAKAPKFCIIVDDVMTTGATTNELAKSLLAAGAQKIHVWCLARAYNVD
ncbi:MAG: ComF family protein [Kangiellaceae bacterium]|nr:ComF family protein [Kangiellaceae bacterium]MCW9000427.1 ComF family protein [Kangiellaceae bacterium]